MATGARAGDRTSSTEHAVVYRESGRFAGWPANNGVWSWDDEIVVGFNQGYFKNVPIGHAIDSQKPSVVRFARSSDGGRRWAVEVPKFLDANDQEQEPVDCDGGIDFAHPDFAMRVRMNQRRGQNARIYYSHDRCKTWQGPYKLPMFDRQHIMARTDYVVLGQHDLLAFITATKEDGREGRVFCTRTTDGGKSWKFVSWIGPEPEGFAIMPSTVRLSPQGILTTIRRREGSEHWIDAYLSSDAGKTWKFVNRPVASTGGSVGNPPSTIMLADGRLAITYGFRSEPYGLRARLSSDHGKTWGAEIVLRDDGGCWDLGYPRTVQRKDGKIVTIYYFNDARDKERYIAASIWDPGHGTGLGFQASP